MRRIKDIPKQERPREKLLRLGANALSNQELVALILSKGSKKKDVLSLAKDVLKVIEKDPENVKVEDLKAIEGVGTVKAIQIVASLILAKRLLIKEGIRILNAQQLFHLNLDLTQKRQESLALVTVDGAGKFLKRRIITSGTINRTIVHPREIFYHAIEDGAYGIFLVHNHPSGETTPSQEDLAITEKITKAGEILGIPLLDHVIVTRRGFFSFREQGLLNAHLGGKNR